VLPLGALLTAASLVIYANLPVHGHYFWNIFPPFLLSGIGLALAWVPAYIAGMTGVQATDAGIASGLLTTSQQIGGAIGLAAATTISITVTDHYLHSHPGTSPLSGAALTHGFQIAFYVLAALVVLAAITAAAIVTSKPPHPVDEVDRASRMAPERLRHGGTAAELAPERST
jgi:MFS family permease